MSIYSKLAGVQSSLKAPKGQYNSFGKYKYRSCEDILEALKPELQKISCVVTLSDAVTQVGDRYYIMATATITDTETGDSACNTAFAREDADKKGMDGSQITGTASSYARKYALNGLFLIDDTKDADTDAYHEQTHADDPAPVKCAVCGGDIKNTRTKSGETHTVAQWLSVSKAQAGKPMCGKCFTAWIKQQGAQPDGDSA